MGSGRYRFGRRPRALAFTSACALALALACASALASACASPQTAADKQFAEMRDSLGRVQADNDKFDQRLGMLEIQLAEERAAREAAQAQAQAKKDGGAAAAPKPTIQLGGGDGRPGENDDPNDPNARPEIRVVGGSTYAGLDGARGASSASRAHAASPALDPDAKRAYEQAVSQIQNKQLDRGLEGLTAFLVRWPDHPYAENAMYWRGEGYYAKGDYAHAADEFEAVLSRFPSGNKTPDALLKLGMSKDRLGDHDRAREIYERLRTEHPKSDAARKIPQTPAAGQSDHSPKGPKEGR